MSQPAPGRSSPASAAREPGEFAPAAATRSAISDLLEEVASLTRPAEVGAAATYWAQAVWSGLGEDDLQTVAWLLRDGDRCGRLPTGDGERARRWAAWLEDAAGEVAVLRGRRATRRRQPRWLRARRSCPRCR